MSEYDSSFVYAPRAELQQLRAMGNRVNSFQIRLKPDAAGDPKLVHEVIIPELQKLFRPGEAQVRSWQQHQGPLLEAIEIERSILNILLFLIVGVSGFSVLAIFSMIVSEKTKDIGILKSLGASSRGIATIFLSYGLTLGLIGSMLGTGLGYLLTIYINEIEQALTVVTGRQIFDRGIYYFDEIPTNIEDVMLILVNIGAIGTSVLFSVLPAWRAARLHPVRALRFE
jgi:lipoprotein-releasing system permease protein